MVDYKPDSKIQTQNLQIQTQNPQHVKLCDEEAAASEEVRRDLGHLLLASSCSWEYDPQSLFLATTMYSLTSFPQEDRTTLSKSQCKPYHISRGEGVGPSLVEDVLPLAARGGQGTDDLPLLLYSTPIPRRPLHALSMVLLTLRVCRTMAYLAPFFSPWAMILRTFGVQVHLL